VIQTGLASALIGSLGTLPFVITGCGGNGGGAPSPNGPFPGTINRSEIGGESLQLISTTGGQVAASDSGSFHSLVGGSAEPIFALDIDRKVRGLAYPGSDTSKSKPITVDADSTLAGILMMTPGIYRSDKALFDETLAKIRALPGYESLRAELAAGLSSGTLKEVLADEAIQSDLQELMHGAMAHRPTRDINVGAGKGGCTMKLISDLNPTGVAATISNQGFRFVRVTRRELDSGDQERAVGDEFKGLGCLEGADQLSIVSAIFGDAFSPTTKDVALTDFSEDHQVEYWISGPGFGAAEDSLEVPPGIDSGYADATALTAIFYIGLPLLSALGIITPDTALWERILASPEVLDLGKDVAELVENLLEGHFSAAGESALNFLEGAFTFLHSIGVLSLSTFWKLLADVFDIVDQIFSVVNLIPAIGYLIAMPAHTKIAMVGNGDGQVIIS